MRWMTGVVCALATAAMLCMGGVASASVLGVSANIQEGSASCGANQPSLPVMGKVSFTRSGNTVTVVTAMKHGKPNSTYDVYLYGNGYFCEYIGLVDEFVTNNAGEGAGVGSLKVPAYDTEFFADPYYALAGGGPEGSNDTPYVSLP